MTTWDGQLLFEALTGTPITVTAYSSNILDLGANRDIGGGGPFAPMIVAGVLQSFASATPSATLIIAVQGAPDAGGSPGTFQTIQQTPAIPLGQLQAGQHPMRLALASVIEWPEWVDTLMTTVATSAAATVASAAGISDGIQIFGNPNVVPGTTVLTGGGTTSLVLSAPASASGTLVATTFGAAFTNMQPGPRFLQLRYICSATFTAGSLYAGITIDPVDEPAQYPGYHWPSSSSAT